MTGFVRRAVQEMAGYTPGEQPQEPGFIKLNTNENAYPPSPRVADALSGVPESLRRYPDPVCTDLRRAIARLHGGRVEQVLIGNGSDEILALAAAAFVERDGSIGYFEPSYSLYTVLADLHEVEKRPVRLNPDFSWRMPAGYSASLFFLANPNAPTSIQYPASDVQSFCRSFAGLVLVDEAYVDFAGYHCMDLALSLPNVLAVRTLSKSYSLAGLRLGYAVGPEPLIEALCKIKDSYNVDALAQRIAWAAIEDGGHMRRNVERIQATRERVAADLAARGFEVAPSETNFLWIKPPRIPARTLFESLRARKILVRHFPGELTGDHLRVTIGSDEEMDAFLRETRAAIRAD